MRVLVSCSSGRKTLSRGFCAVFQRCRHRSSPAFATGSDDIGGVPDKVDLRNIPDASSYRSDGTLNFVSPTSIWPLILAPPARGPDSRRIAHQRRSVGDGLDQHETINRSGVGWQRSSSGHPPSDLICPPSAARRADRFDRRTVVQLWQIATAVATPGTGRGARGFVC